MDQKTSNATTEQSAESDVSAKLEQLKLAMETAEKEYETRQTLVNRKKEELNQATASSFEQLQVVQRAQSEFLVSYINVRNLQLQESNNEVQRLRKLYEHKKE